jgi:hypothetical protein
VLPWVGLEGERRIDGPAFVELPTTTAVIYPGQTAWLDEDRNLVMAIELGETGRA